MGVAATERVVHAEGVPLYRDLGSGQARVRARSTLVCPEWSRYADANARSSRASATRPAVGCSLGAGPRRVVSIRGLELAGARRIRYTTSGAACRLGAGPRRVVSIRGPGLAGARRGRYSTGGGGCALDADPRRVVSIRGPGLAGARRGRYSTSGAGWALGAGPRRVVSIRGPGLAGARRVRYSTSGGGYSTSGAGWGGLDLAERGRRWWPRGRCGEPGRIPSVDA